jgi:UbiD family decarboxylase
MSDLRTFLDRVRRERRSDLLEIEREVSPRHETTAIMTKLERRQRSPILFFKKVAASPFPLVSNLCGSMGRIALALDCPLNLVSERYAERSQQRIPPLLTRDAPVQRNVLRGNEVDLRLLPQLVYHEHDTDRPYITAGIVVARHPDTQRVNLSYHRLMIAGRDKTAIYMEPTRHLDSIYQAHVKAGREMPIAVFIGGHPLWSLGALYSGPEEEYSVIGGLLTSPLPVARCVLQNDLSVPAQAEFVLEGIVPPDERIEEGPFGEFTGYGTGITQTPVFHVQAMTFRDHPIFQDVISGHMEHLTLTVPALQHRILSDARRVAGGVTRVGFLAPLTIVVALKKSNDDEPKQILQTLLEHDIYAKHVIVVDAHVDIGDLREVFTAVALNVQASRDVYIYPDLQGTPLDPSCPTHEGRVSKMGIDATQRIASNRPLMRNTVPQGVLDSIDISELLGHRPEVTHDSNRGMQKD